MLQQVQSTSTTTNVTPASTRGRGRGRGRGTQPNISRGQEDYGTYYINELGFCQALAGKRLPA